MFQDARHVTAAELNNAVNSLQEKLDTSEKLMGTKLDRIINLFQAHMNCETIKDLEQEQTIYDPVQQMKQAFASLDQTTIPPKPKTEPLSAYYFAEQATHIMEQRGQTYDSASGERSMERTVAVFNAYLGTNLTESQGWLFMDILKTVRAFNKKSFHQDSCEDKVAYACLLAESMSKER